MKKLIFALTGIILFFSANVSAQSIQKRQLDEFTGIHQETFADVYISQGDQTTVTVKADKDVIDRLITKVDHGVLTITSKGNFRNVNAFEVHVTMSRIDLIKNTGSGDIYFLASLPGNDVVIDITGSGNLSAELQAKNLKLDINGSGDVDLSGVRGDFSVSVSGSGDLKAENLQLENCDVLSTGSGDMELEGSAVSLTVVQNGSGDLDARELKAVNVKVNNTGPGDCSIYAVNNLLVSLNGSGDLVYYGAPEKMSIVTNGSGEVYKR